MKELANPMRQQATMLKFLGYVWCCSSHLPVMCMCSCTGSSVFKFTDTGHDPCFSISRQNFWHCSWFCKDLCSCSCYGKFSGLHNLALNYKREKVQPSWYYFIIFNLFWSMFAKNNHFMEWGFVLAIILLFGGQIPSLVTFFSPDIRMWL